MTLSYLTEPSSLDPAVAWNVIDWQIEHDIYQGFLQYAHESGQAGTELIPCLATEVPNTENGGISADGKTYTFHLRKGVMFQPPVSREVTAADFKYSFERMMREPRAPATSFYMGVVGADQYMKGKADEISGFKAVDDSTVEITLKSRTSRSSTRSPWTLRCRPQEWVEKWGKQFNRNPLGTGPFVFQKWTPGREIVLTRNPQYWEEGRPYLDESTTSSPSRPRRRCSSSSAAKLTCSAMACRPPTWRASRRTPAGTSRSSPSRWWRSATCS